MSIDSARSLPLPTELQQLAATLAWRRFAAEAVVPVFAQIELPTRSGPDFNPLQVRANDGAI